MAPEGISVACSRLIEPARIQVVRRPEKLLPDDKRVITRYLDFGSPRRIRSILRRLLRIKEEDVAPLLQDVMSDFSSRHRDVEADFLASFNRVLKYIDPARGISEPRRLLIGAYFTLEYSIESAALFNPSIVMHPDQTDLPEGAVRFLMSLRATGEGHVSSIVFRRGVIGAGGDIAFDPPPRYARPSRLTPDRMLDKTWFIRKLAEMHLYDELAIRILEALPDRFDYEALHRTIACVKKTAGKRTAFRNIAAGMLWLARANYDVRFPEDCHPAEIVIFPATESERHGMEDLRLTRFVDDDGQVSYMGTYTAYGAARTRPMLLRSADLANFHVRTLGGRHIKNKGLALFPRRIDGSYLMVSRHDGENLWLLWSDNLYSWDGASRLQAPREPWELIQLGNCGSPLETEAGWIVLTHGVGPVRRYCIGAILLDRQDPERVIGRLKDPLLIPTDQEREGYVPNVLYSCGSMIHNDRLIIPYAMSDQATSFATVSVSDLTDLLLDYGP
ncbi:MAG: glycoside hydrolase family 130 protein [Phycisphaerae bacterium]|nr:glycoside hydrolase family 130 protein [Phycisphaerae bacterium]